MADWVAIAKRSEIPDDCGHVVALDGRSIALFLVDGEVFAMDDVCPHMGASLGSGAVAEGVVTCPWHGWRFRVTDGSWLSVPKNCIPCYATKVEGENIFVDKTW